MSGQIPLSNYKPLNNNVKMNNNGGIFDYILKNEFLLLVFGFIAMVGVAVVVAVLYEKQPEDRESVAFTQFNLILLGLGFIYIIITFMGQTINILGKTFDMGMILYIAIVMFIMFMLG
jgi:hypothetical protein